MRTIKESIHRSIAGCIATAPPAAPARIRSLPVLIDWHVAARMQANPFEERITGTRLFTAHRLSSPAQLHSLQYDRESLLSVSFHVSTDGQLPCAHSPDKNIDATSALASHLGCTV
jgi:hypothetical protein